jgi:hypothetical protein
MTEDPRLTAKKSVFLVEEWVESQVRHTHLVEVAMVRWMPPSDGWVKVNTDGVYSPQRNYGGGGAVMRDHHGRFIAGSCCFFPTDSDPERAELLACNQGVNLAIQRGETKIILEIDCQSVVTKLQREELDRSIHGTFVEDIKALL